MNTVLGFGILCVTLLTALVVRLWWRVRDVEQQSEMFGRYLFRHVFGYIVVGVPASRERERFRDIVQEVDLKGGDSA